MPALRPNTTTRSQGIPMDDELEAAIVLAYQSTDGGVTWEPSSGGVSAPPTYDIEAVEIAVAGDNVIRAPAPGMRLEINWIGLFSSQDNTGEVLAIVRMGADAKYRVPLGNPGAFAHRDSFSGAVGEEFIVNLSVSGRPVQVNYTWREI